jgi:hypothetical protein
MLGAALFAGLELVVACSNDEVVTPVDGQASTDGAAFETASDSRADADGSAADSIDPDIVPCDASMDDPRNCSRCGHDCIGGACVAGVCQPWSILDTPASDIASDNALVYWVSGPSGKVASCPRTGCPFATTLVSNAPVPSKIAVDNASVYYTTSIADGGYLASCAKGGCDGGPAILSGGHAYPSSLVVDVNAVFYDVNGADIFQCTLPTCGNGSSSITPTTVARGLAEEWNLLYWTEGATTIWECQKGSCEATRKLIGSSFTSLGAVAAYGGTVFGVERGASGKILRCPNAPNCIPVTIAQNLEDPDDIESDWTGIYFITHGANPATSGALNFCPLGGCVGPPRILVGNLSYANAVALDQDAVYVASSGSPIMGVAKP